MKTIMTLIFTMYFLCLMIFMIILMSWLLVNDARAEEVQPQADTIITCQDNDTTSICVGQT